jgi:F-type H+-transporting ATPase subunit b
LEKLGINLGYLLVQVFNFLILLIVLRAWVYKPLMNLLEKRRKTIAEGIENSRMAAEARANAEQEAEKVNAEAQAKAAHIISEATEKADAAMVEVRVEADNEIAKEREATLEEVEAERNRMLGDLRGQVATLAIAAAQKLVGEALDEKRQRALLSEFFSGVSSGKVVVLEDAELVAGCAEITSALPLTDEEKAIVRKDVLSKMGAQAQIDFRVDPNILGGLVVRVGDKVVDGSVAGQLESLRQSLR